MFCVHIKIRDFEREGRFFSWMSETFYRIGAANLGVFGV
jgi:hypothetical protein